jgi:hypothetical protein
VSDQSVVWDGKDMTAVQMLLHDLRQQGEPCAQWYIRRDGVPVLHVRMYPGGPMEPIEIGTKIIRFHGGDHLATVFERFPHPWGAAGKTD